MNHVLFAHAYQAGFVKRHHVNPSDAVQTVGHHSWGVAMILDYIWPDAPKKVILAALRHDVPERWTGDIPAYVKWRYPDLASSMNTAEAGVERLLGYDLELTQHEAAALKVADMLELMMFSLHRSSMGDKYFGDVGSNVRQWFNTSGESMIQMFPKALEIYDSISRFHFTANP
jgi:5'-deoxynucleotidase YfbR-like HD superfamily hydrolase